MTKLRIFALVLLAIGISACGAYYEPPVPTENGQLRIFGRTGFFGTDMAGALYEENKPVQPVPDKLTLAHFWWRQTTAQDYDQKCPDPKQLKNIHTHTENAQGGWQEEVPNPHKRPPQSQMMMGTNPSTGNFLLPAAALAAGTATSGGLYPAMNVTASAVGKGGSADATGVGKGGSAAATGTGVGVGVGAGPSGSAAGSGSGSGVASAGAGP